MDDLDEVLAKIDRGEWSLRGQPRDGFFIPEETCLWCGVCHGMAPGIIVWREARDGHRSSVFTRQPSTEEELRQALDAAGCCTHRSIYYGGPDADLRERVRIERNGQDRTDDGA